GIGYYGKCVRGQWSSGTGGGKLQRGSSIMPEDVFMTIVFTRPQFVRATVEEKDLHLIRPEMKGKATPAAYPELKVPARVIKVSGIPQSAGTFEARIAVELGKDADFVVPGMACTVKLVAFKKADALTVPAAAVFSDDGED